MNNIPMKTLTLLMLFPIFLLADEAKQSFEKIIEKTPSLAVKLIAPSNTITTEANKSFRRTDLIKKIAVQDITISDNKVLYRGEPLPLEDEKISSADVENYYEKIKEKPEMIYTWHFTIKEEGDYLINTDCSTASRGLLNEKIIYCDINGNLIEASGQVFVHLKPGKKTIALKIKARQKYNIRIINAKELPTYQNQIITNLEKDSGKVFFFNEMLPLLSNESTSNRELRTNFVKHYLNKFKSNLTEDDKDSLISLFWNSQDQNTADFYFLLKETLPGFLSKILFRKKGFEALNISKTFIARTLFYLNNQKEANSFYEEVLKIAEDSTFEDAENIKKILLADLTFAHIIFGNYEQAIATLQKTNETISDNKTPRPNQLLKIIKSLETRITREPPEPAYKLMTTDNIAETSLFEINELITNYKGDQEALNKAWRWLENLQDRLTLKEDRSAQSLMGRLLQGIQINKKFGQDLVNFASKKLEDRIKSAIELGNTQNLNNLFHKYGSILPMSDVHRVLFRHFQQKGMISLAIYHGQKLKQNNALEASQEKEDLLNICALTLKPEKELKLGSIWKQIETPAYHELYWAHMLYDFVQTAEVTANNNTFFLHSPNQLIAIDAKSKAENWAYNFGFEYKNFYEGDPYQKRAIAKIFGNQLFCYGPSVEGDDKSILNFKTDGTLLWDTAQNYKETHMEPICTPIFAGGKVYALTKSKNETIQIVHLTTIDPLTGQYTNILPLSKISKNSRTIVANEDKFYWNTYRQDDHFTQDENHVYAYTGTGMVFKFDPITKAIIWAKSYHRLSSTDFKVNPLDFAGAASGFIKSLDQTVVVAMPDIQTLCGYDKQTGEEKWRNYFLFPHLIHSRNNNNSFIMSKNGYGKQASVYCLEPETGKEKWITNLNALVPTGEGITANNTIFIPVQNGIILLSTQTGEIIKHITTPITFDKIRDANGKIVLFSKNNTWILNDDDKFDAKAFKSKYEKSFNLTEPDTAPSPHHQMDNPDIEKTIPLPEKFMVIGDHWRETELIKTTKPFHHILKATESICLIREGFQQKNGDYVPPAIIWNEVNPYHQLFSDKILISKAGLLKIEDVFSRKTIWQHEYTKEVEIAKENMDNYAPFAVTDEKFIALQLADGVIRIFDYKTKDVLFHLPAESNGQLAISDGVLIRKIDDDVKAYDLNEQGKHLWTQENNHRTDIFAKNGMFIYIRYSGSYSYTFYDLKTGKELVKASSTTKNQYKTVKWNIDEKVIYAYDNIYDRNTGKVLANSKEAIQVKNGGYLTFSSLYGEKGNYYENGTLYPFELAARRDRNSIHLTAIKKGDQIIIFSTSAIERFKIDKGKLVPCDYISCTMGNYGSQAQAHLRLFSLDNSFLALRSNQMIFIRDFKGDDNLNNFDTYTAEEDTSWPTRDSYPETEITQNNWVAETNIKPTFTPFYQFGVNSEFAFFKLRINFDETENNLKHILNIRTSSGGNISYIYWDFMNWDFATTSRGLEPYVKTWKQIDTHGNMNLYLKIKYDAGMLANNDFKSISQLGIELASFKENAKIGFYRIGGAAAKSPEPFAWKLRRSHQSNNLENILKRENLYDSLNGIYPHGIEITSWLASRRKVFGSASNIQWLENTIIRNKESFGVVNYLAAMVLEKLIQKNHNAQDVIQKTYKADALEAIAQVNKIGLENNINKEWLEFALSIVTIEIYPNKQTYYNIRDHIAIPIFKTEVYLGKQILSSEDYSEGTYSVEASMYNPHIIYAMPGLLTNYLDQEQNEQLRINLCGISPLRTNFGEITFFQGGKAKTLISQNGSNQKIEFFINSKKIAVTPKIYFSDANQIPVYYFEKRTNPDNILFIIPEFKGPKVAMGQGLNKESAKKILDDLPNDSDIGYGLIQSFKNLSGKSEIKYEEMLVAWLKNLGSNNYATVKASRKIFIESEQKNNYDYIAALWKEAKTPLIARRMFTINYNDIFNKSNTFSFLGPFENDLEKEPFETTDLTTEFSDGSKKGKFTEEVPKEQGGKAYWATKIISEKDTKCTLLFKGYSRLSNSLCNAWLNEKQIITNEMPANFPKSILVQKLTLKKGENIFIMKIEPGETRYWREFSLTIGDSAGVPMPELKIIPVHK